ncbi:MAG: NUDIX domain-containing protein [Candidatus Gottesmanbacteria bacterium]
MKIEHSSGAVIVKKLNRSWHVLCIRDMNGNLTFPKGLMEKNETAKETAIREAQEETGISNLTYAASLPDVSYFYVKNGESINKIVQYQLFTYAGSETLTPQKEEGITELVWIPLEHVSALIGYPSSNQPLLNEVKRIISLQS